MYIWPQRASPRKPKPMIHSPKAQQSHLAKIPIREHIHIRNVFGPQVSFLIKTFPVPHDTFTEILFVSSFSGTRFRHWRLISYKAWNELSAHNFQKIGLGLYRTPFWSDHLHVGLFASKLVRLILLKPCCLLGFSVPDSFIWILFCPSLWAVTGSPSYF